MAVVEARLQIRDWKDKDGNNSRPAEIVAENVYFGDSKRDDGGTFGMTYGESPVSVSVGFTEVADSDDGDDLPF
jgi:single-strand DNA-binding protein